MSGDVDPFERAVAEAERRWGTATPYRIGLVLGERVLQVQPLAGRPQHWLKQVCEGIQESRAALATQDKAGNDESQSWHEAVARFVQLPGYRVAAIEGERHESEIRIVLQRVNGLPGIDRRLMRGG